jgi:hypothetical protein
MSLPRVMRCRAGSFSLFDFGQVSEMKNRGLTFPARATIIDLPGKGGSEAVTLRCISARRLLSALSVVVAGVFLHLAVSAADEPAQTPSTTVDGSLSLRYTFRTVASADERTSDQDVFADLRLDVTQPADARHAFHFLGALRSDLDGDRDRTFFSPLEDAGDAYGRRTTGTVYEAYYALNRPFSRLAQMRAGRQAGTRDEPVFFDGLAADLGADAWNITLYGGAALHFAEVDRHWGNDTLGGAGIDYTPAAGLRLSADWLSVSDEREWDPEGGTEKDRMAAFQVRQQLETYAQYAVKYRLLNGEPRDLSIAASAAYPAWDAEAAARYIRQFRVQDELTTDLSPVADVIGRSAPFQSVDLKVRKTVSERVALDAGYFQRSLLRPSDEGPFNKEYSRKYLAGDIADLFLPGLSWTLTAERWDAGTTETNAYGADITYRRKHQGREARVGAGTYYSLYKYDHFSELGLRDKVRTYYIDVRYPLGRSFSVNGRYELERGMEEYQTVRLGMQYAF